MSSSHSITEPSTWLMASKCVPKALPRFSRTKFRMRTVCSPSQQNKMMILVDRNLDLVREFLFFLPLPSSFSSSHSLGSEGRGSRERVTSLAFSTVCLQLFPPLNRRLCHPLLPSSLMLVAAAVPPLVAGISMRESIAHRNDIPLVLKQVITHTIHEYRLLLLLLLQSCAGAELESVAAEQRLFWGMKSEMEREEEREGVCEEQGNDAEKRRRRRIEEGSEYAPHFLNALPLVYQELKDFFDPSSLARLLLPLLPSSLAGKTKSSALDMLLLQCKERPETVQRAGAEFSFASPSSPFSPVASPSSGNWDLYDLLHLQQARMIEPETAGVEDHFTAEFLAGSFSVKASSSFSASLQSVIPPPPVQKKKQESDHGDDYYVNVGNAIRTMREELPTMFVKDMTYDIYRDDITFSDPLNTFHGLDKYKRIFWALRFHGKMFFRALRVDIGRIWQPCDNIIMVRWSVFGLPRVPWEAQGFFDGTSEYRLDRNGKIYAHKVTNVIMSDMMKFQPLTVMDLLRLAGVSMSPAPTACGAGWKSRI